MHTTTKTILTISIALIAITLPASASLTEYDWYDTPAPIHAAAPVYDYSSPLTGDDVLQHQRDVSEWRADVRTTNDEYHRQQDRDQYCRESRRTSGQRTVDALFAANEGYCDQRAYEQTTDRTTTTQHTDNDAYSDDAWPSLWFIGFFFILWLMIPRD